MKFLLWLSFIFNASSFLNGFDSIRDYFGSESCSNYFIPEDWEGLKKSLQTEIVGQPFITNELIAVLKDRSYMSKPLVLSFHGSPGTGKNYVSNFLAQFMFRKGKESKFVHYFSGKMHFTRIALIDEYKEDLQTWIKGNLTECERSLFVFDEVDSFSPVVLNALQPFLNHGQEFIRNTDFSKSIFIFLSNIGMEHINELTLKLWKSGTKRKDFNHQSFKGLIEESYTSEGGFKNSALIDSSVIDLFIPFLPLEKEHVKECIKQVAINTKRRLSETQIEDVINYLDFVPESMELFSRHGCKNIHTAVTIVFHKLLKNEL